MQLKDCDFGYGPFLLHLLTIGIDSESHILE